jgi:hypothetical protein
MQSKVFTLRVGFMLHDVIFFNFDHQHGVHLLEASPIGRSTNRYPKQIFINSLICFNDSLCNNEKVRDTITRFAHIFFGIPIDRSEVPAPYGVPLRFVIYLPKVPKIAKQNFLTQ